MDAVAHECEGAALLHDRLSPFHGEEAFAFALVGGVVVAVQRGAAHVVDPVHLVGIRQNDAALLMQDDGAVAAQIGQDVGCGPVPVAVQAGKIEIDDARLQLAPLHKEVVLRQLHALHCAGELRAGLRAQQHFLGARLPMSKEDDRRRSHEGDGTHHGKEAHAEGAAFPVAHAGRLTLFESVPFGAAGRQEAACEGEKEGDLYAVVAVDGFNEAEKVEIFHDTYTNGELISISSSKIETVSGFGREVEYDLDDDAEFTLNGSEASYRDIKNALDDGDVLVTLEFDDDNIVTKVTAQLKKVKGTLKSADDKRIVVVDDDDNRMALTVTRLVECEFNGEEVSYARFQGMFEDTENAVMAEVELDDEGVVEKIVAVEGSETEGKVVELNSDKIIIEDAAGVEHEYKLESFIRGYLNGEELFPASRIFEDARDKDATVELAFSSRGHVNRIYVTLD